MARNERSRSRGMRRHDGRNPHPDHPGRRSRPSKRPFGDASQATSLLRPAAAEKPCGVRQLQKSARRGVFLQKRKSTSPVTARPPRRGDAERPPSSRFAFRVSPASPVTARATRHVHSFTCHVDGFTCHVGRLDVPRRRDAGRPARAPRAMWTRHWRSSPRSTCHVDAILAVQRALHVPRRRRTERSASRPRPT